MKSLPNRTRTRLSVELYDKPGLPCSITIGVRDRTPVFLNPAIADGAAQVLCRLAAQTGVSVYAYCLMPDHVHLLLSASEQCGLVTFIKRFKELSVREAWRLGVSGTFWQESFWDHFLRQEEDLAQAVRYILNNPVRRGLVANWQDYPYAGSLVYTSETLG